MANLENLKKLRDQLARLPDEKFDMGTWVQHGERCGTVACIAGWASILNGGPTKMPSGRFYFEAEPEEFPEGFARKWLGLTERQAGRLFAGNFVPAVRKRHRDFETVTRVEAIAELDRMIAAETEPVS